MQLRHPTTPSPPWSAVAPPPHHCSVSVGLEWVLPTAGPRLGARPVAAAAPGATRGGPGRTRRPRATGSARPAARGPTMRCRRGGSTSGSSSTSTPALLASVPRPPFSGIAKRGSEHRGPTRSPDAAATHPLVATARLPACDGVAPQPACERGAQLAGCPPAPARPETRAWRGLAAARPDRSSHDDHPLPHRILPR